MQFTLKAFDELDVETLYAILKLRVDVFVVEQNCPYAELDGHDIKALHLYVQDKSKIIAYARILPKGITYDTPAIGRVIVSREYRGDGIARLLMNKAIDVIYRDWDDNTVSIGAQVYLQYFYQSLGFRAISDEYIEDGIPHVDMQLIISP